MEILAGEEACYRLLAFICIKWNYIGGQILQGVYAKICLSLKNWLILILYRIIDNTPVKCHATVHRDTIISFEYFLIFTGSSQTNVSYGASWFPTLCGMFDLETGIAQPSYFFQP
jgi:hypothetical protein